MIIGKLNCENCGCDVTNLYGYALAVRGTIRSQATQAELVKVKKEFGKENFYWCWSCTAKAFGAKPLETKEPETITKDSAQTVVIESCNKEKKNNVCRA
jgi:hypothetical protein